MAIISISPLGFCLLGFSTSEVTGVYFCGVFFALNYPSYQVLNFMDMKLKVIITCNCSVHSAPVARILFSFLMLFVTLLPSRSSVLVVLQAASTGL